MAPRDPLNSGVHLSPCGIAIRRLALARGITYSGGNAAFWALSAILYQRTHSPGLVAAAALASFSVPAALSPLAGWLGDHVDRKQVMVGSELAGAVTFLGMACVGSPAALLGLRVLASAASAPLVPATSAALPKLVPEHRLEEANGALSKAGTAGGLIGPAVAGIMLTLVGGSWVFVLNALTFLASAGLILSVHGDFRPRRTRRGGIVAGFTYLRRNRALRKMSVAYAVIFVGVGITVPAEIVLAAEFGVGSLGYAALICLWGLGAVLGASLAERFGAGQRQMALLSAAALVFSFGFLTVGAAPLFALALLGMASAGTGSGLWEVAQTSFVQRVTPDELRSRVLAASEALMQGGVAVGLLGSSAVVAAAGARGAFAVAGGASLAAALILLFRGLGAAATTPQDCSRLSFREYDARRGAGLELPQFNHSCPAPACLANGPPAQLEP